MPVAALAVAVVYTLSVYPSLPARVPMKWGLDGQPTRWASREFGAWFLPVVTALIFVSMQIAVRLDPRRANDPRARESVEIVAFGTVTFMSIIQVAAMRAALGLASHMIAIVFIGLAVLVALTLYAGVRARR